MPVTTLASKPVSAAVFPMSNSGGGHDEFAPQGTTISGHESNESCPRDRHNVRDLKGKRKFEPDTPTQCYVPDKPTGKQ